MVVGLTLKEGVKQMDKGAPNVEHPLQNDNIQNIFISVFIYHINKYVYIMK